MNPVGFMDYVGRKVERWSFQKEDFMRRGTESKIRQLRRITVEE